MNELLSALCSCAITSGKSIKVHLYWAMKNCGGSPEQRCSLIKNVPQHYMVQGCSQKCHEGGGGVRGMQYHLYGHSDFFLVICVRA